MNWHINDLSLDGQFDEPFSLRRAIEPLIRLMNERKDLRGRIFCSRNLSTRPVTASHNLAQAVLAVRDQLFVSLVLRWVNKAGPFWEPDRLANEYDLFYFEGENVTEQGLGEAARRLAGDLPAGSFSFVQSPRDRFAVGALSVVHGFLEEPFGSYVVTNVWDVGALPVATSEPLQSWEQMLARAAEEMPGLFFSNAIAGKLAPRPFDPGAAERMLVLLKVLQRLTEETRADGGLTSTGLDIYQQHCVGDRARISDEMTFPDPRDPAKEILCSWHAKLNFGVQYRIHFEWPRPRGQREIKVCYIGIKIARY
jgi:hypothetical protein